MSRGQKVFSVKSQARNLHSIGLLTWVRTSEVPYGDAIVVGASSPRRAEGCAGISSTTHTVLVVATFAIGVTLSPLGQRIRTALVDTNEHSVHQDRIPSLEADGAHSPADGSSEPMADRAFDTAQVDRPSWTPRGDTPRVHPATAPATMPSLWRAPLWNVLEWTRGATTASVSQTLAFLANPLSMPALSVGGGVDLVMQNGWQAPGWYLYHLDNLVMANRNPYEHESVAAQQYLDELTALWALRDRPHGGDNPAKRAYANAAHALAESVDAAARGPRATPPGFNAVEREIVEPWELESYHGATPGETQVFPQD